MRRAKGEPASQVDEFNLLTPDKSGDPRNQLHLERSVSGFSYERSESNMFRRRDPTRRRRKAGGSNAEKVPCSAHLTLRLLLHAARDKIQRHELMRKASGLSGGGLAFEKR